VDDLKSKLDKLLAEATDCDMIGNLASDKAKRELFRKLASDLRRMAQDIEALIAVKSQADGLAEREPLSSLSEPP